MSYRISNVILLPYMQPPYPTNPHYSVRNFIDEKLYGVTSLQDNSAILDSIEANWTPYALRLQAMKQVSRLTRFDTPAN
jgi:hypothetical protein